MILFMFALTTGYDGDALIANAKWRKYRGILMVESREKIRQVQENWSQ